MGVITLALVAEDLPFGDPGPDADAAATHRLRMVFLATIVMIRSLFAVAPGSGIPDDDDWAASVLDAVQADRAEQHPGERAVPVAAHDEQLRVVAHLDQLLRWMPFDDVQGELVVRAGSEHVVDRVYEGLPGLTFEVSRHVRVDLRQLPRD